MLKKYLIIFLIFNITLLFSKNIFIDFFKLPTKKEKQNERKYTVIPIGGYNEETGFLIGGLCSYLYKKNKTKNGIFNSKLDILAIYTAKKQTRLSLKINDYFKKNKSKLFCDISYKNWHKDYFGKGATTKKENCKKYYYQSYTIETSYKKEFKNIFFTGLKVNLSRNRNYRFKEQSIFYYKRGLGNYNLFGIGPVFEIDSRDNNIFPKAGYFFQSETLFFEKIFRDSYKYIIQLLEFKYYLNLTKETSHKYNIFVSRIAYQASTGKVPFSLLPGIGGNKNMRGLKSGRFKDKHTLYYELEYRTRIYQRIGIVGFTGIGNVGANPSQIFKTSPKIILGVGFRYQINSMGLNFRIDLGYSLTDKSYTKIISGGEAY